MQKPVVEVTTATDDQKIVEEIIVENEIPEPEPEPEKEPEKEPELKKVKKDDDEIPEPDNPIVLKNPILINGKQRKELTWTEEISSEQFLQADELTHKGRVSVTTAAELDTGMMFYLGVMMVCAANQEIDPKDLEQIKGRDNLSLMKVGRFFLRASDED